MSRAEQRFWTLVFSVGASLAALSEVEFLLTHARLGSGPDTGAFLYSVVTLATFAGNVLLLRHVRRQHHQARK
jgi:hypothetical protein